MTSGLLTLLLAAGVAIDGTQVREDTSIPDSAILTPLPSPEPRINGPGVFGVRPGHPVLYTIPATGKRPMTFSAQGMPAGLNLDGATGRFSGSIRFRGTFSLKLSTRNSLGTAEREFRLVVGDTIALTPPMGWNSWNGWGDHVTAENVRNTADAIVRSGLADHGWAYVTIDIGWEGKRGGRYNAIQPNEKFPDMQSLCDYVHSLGLKIGIYSTPWVKGYFGYTGGSSDDPNGNDDSAAIAQGADAGRHIGKYLFTVDDTRQFDEWGIDFLKYDWTSRVDAREPVDPARALAGALRTCRRDIVFSLCNLFSPDDAPRRLPYVQLWRTTNDIRDVWDNATLTRDLWAEGISNIWDLHREWREFTGPGRWPDPEVLAVGWVGFGDRELHRTRLTPDEQYTHVSLWCLWSAPLFIGCPVEQLDEFTLRLLSNDEVIAIDQDPLGRQAYLAAKEGGGEVLVKRMEDGSKAVGLFNRSLNRMTISAQWVNLGNYGKYRVRDVWRQKDLGTFGKSFSAEVPPHGVVLVRMFPD